jgi:subtilisin-like proprotein convertase family protein
MNKNLLLALIAVVTFSGYAQKPLWSSITEAEIGKAEKTEMASMPAKYQLFSLDLEALKQRLSVAPSRDNYNGQSNVIVAFPNAEGKLENFRIYESSIMHPELAAKHPDIKSYVGTGVENPGKTIRFSTTIFGLHTMTFSEKGSYYINPYTKDLNNYIVYAKSSLRPARTFGCTIEGEEEYAQRMASEMVATSTMAGDGILRKYRLALACTIEYAAFRVNQAGLQSGTEAQKKAAVLAAMNVTMTRVNGIYERDMAITMELVPNNENVVFVTSDNFNNDNAGTLLSQSQTVINNAIGYFNYDIGHVVSTTSAGGVAQLGCVCSADKARGITGSSAPVGDTYDVDYVAHEMGHQFGATHTFNNANQRTASTAVEPGSGSTIMAYAGISPPNVQSNSDDYFHAASLAQMFNFVLTSGNCAVTQSNGNAAPVIPALNSYTIPKSTAFILKSPLVTDANNDALTYCWEQTNANGASSTQDNTPFATSTSGPNFRSLPPVTSPDRYMPSLENVLQGNLTPTWEVVPSVGRTLNFALTVRDNHVPNGGQTARKDMTVTVSGSAGPFRVTSQNVEGISWQQGSTQTVTWDVAGTTANNINTTNVNILLSTDGGQNFDTVLVSNTPNDGSETINVPNVAAPFCRLKVEPVNNIYYAVNSTPFAVGYTVTTTCNTYTNNTPLAIPNGVNSFSSSLISVPAGQNATTSSVNVSVNISHTDISDLFLAVLGPNDSQVTLWNTQCYVQNILYSGLNVKFSDTGSAVSCSSPTTGIITPWESLSAFNNINAAGNWLLGLIDPYPGPSSGTLNSWSVEICSQQITAGTNEYGLDNFTLYPNPNNGGFTVGFDSTTSNDIKIAVHDMRGREVYNQSYTNTGIFSGNINLGAVQSGVYLVTVQDGSKKVVKKIAIN